jgi:exopolyphosphatase/guanosine-5'-triphosphate,3'-diphosphate pyrophosphatase
LLIIYAIFAGLRMENNRIAILDLGTNTFHLLIASLSEKNFEIIVKEKIPVKIGEGGISRSIISRGAKIRALSAVGRFKNIIEENDVSEVIAFATSAIRTASNGAELLNEIYNLTGIKAMIINGNQEAQYIFNGVRQALDLGDSISLIMDIGGGSVEFIIGNAHTILWKRSFEIGAQRLLDKFHRNDPVQNEDLTRLNHYLEKQLQPLIQAALEFHPKVLIGSSGTFDTISDIYCSERNITRDPAATEHPIQLEAFFDIHKELVLKNREERLAIPGMAEMRVDMIVMSSALLHFVLTRLGLTKMRASAYSLKEGILYSLIERRIIKQLSA